MIEKLVFSINRRINTEDRRNSLECKNKIIWIWLRNLWQFFCYAIAWATSVWVLCETMFAIRQGVQFASKPRCEYVWV